MRTRVRVTQGELQGRERDGCLLFAGIPYAAPPVGERRLAPPAPAEPWRGLRDATRFGPAAPQRPGTGLTAAPLAWDEDCLTLNVCTPAADDGARPVMVWIHGGAFRTGKGGIPWYDGHAFAGRGDVVTVTINYRLGALGFAHLPELGGEEVASSGLNGILDQIAALRWVRDHIAAFGGDPEQVTIAGESAGAMSVGTLLGCPAARGLFRAAIAQSGAAHHCVDAVTGAAVGRLWLRELGVDSLAALRALPVDALLDAQQRVEAIVMRSVEIEGVDVRHLGDMVFVPVVEGRSLPRDPLAAVRDGACAEVDLLIGTNADETTLWGTPSNVDDARLRQVAKRYFPDVERALRIYRAAHPGATPAQLEIAITTDHLFRIPALRLAEAQAATGARVWQYLFTWRSRAFGGRLGATHALEIPFVFHSLDRPGVDAFLGEGERPTALADRMHAAWTAFVRSGDPACEALPPWPRYDDKRRPVMELGDEPRVLEDPGADTRRLWDGLR